MVDVAGAFLELRDKRHAADYGQLADFSKEAALNLASSSSSRGHGARASPGCGISCPCSVPRARFTEDKDRVSGQGNIRALRWSLWDSPAASLAMLADRSCASSAGWPASIYPSLAGRLHVDREEGEDHEVGALALDHSA